MRPWLGPMRHLVTASTDMLDAGAPAVPVERRARALSVLASVAAYRGDYAEAAAFHQECVSLSRGEIKATRTRERVSLSRECGDHAGVVRSLGALPCYVWLAGATERVADILAESPLVVNWVIQN